MYLVLKEDAGPDEIKRLHQRLEMLGIDARTETRDGRECITVDRGEDRGLSLHMLTGNLPGVEEMQSTENGSRLPELEGKPGPGTVKIDDLTIGGDELVFFSGPCSVEDRDQMMRTAEKIAREGGQVLRGGAFKPRTSPHSFQGLGEKGLKLLREAADAHDLRVITEAMEPGTVDLVDAYTDLFQVGARNMQNFPLLEELGRQDRPVFLKRSFGSTYREWILAAEYLLEGGNDRVILCERGIRTVGSFQKTIPDLVSIPTIQELTDYPVVLDPSHGTGIRRMVPALARAGAAAGADGLMIEVHPNPETARSDSQQQLNFEEFSSLMEQIRALEEGLPVRVPSRNRGE